MFFFFFSSRRRHTRCGRDWSSDVCSSDLVPQARPEVADKVMRAYQRSTAPVALRSRAEIERFFGGFDLVEPGLEQVQRWRPDGPGPTVYGGIFGGVGRKS